MWLRNQLSVQESLGKHRYLHYNTGKTSTKRKEETSKNNKRKGHSEKTLYKTGFPDILKRIKICSASQGNAGQNKVSYNWGWLVLTKTGSNRGPRGVVGGPRHCNWTVTWCHYDGFACWLGYALMEMAILHLVPRQQNCMHLIWFLGNRIVCTCIALLTTDSHWNNPMSIISEMHK